MAKTKTKLEPAASADPESATVQEPQGLRKHIRDNVAKAFEAHGLSVPKEWSDFISSAPVVT